MSGASPRIDAKHLNAGRDISVHQQSGTFYYNSQDTSAPPKTIQEDISMLVSKVQSKTVPLSQCIAEALALAVKARNTELEQFCRRELEGSKFKQDTDPETISHRLVSGYLGVGEIANAHSYPDVHTLFATLANSEYFRQAWIPLLEPISLVEHKRDGARPNTIIRLTHRLGDIKPGTETPDVPVFLYGSGDAYAQVVETTRTALTRKLLSLSASNEDT